MIRKFIYAQLKPGKVNDMITNTEAEWDDSGRLNPKSGDEETVHNKILVDSNPNSTLPGLIRGWQFLGIRQNLTAKAEDMFWRRYLDGNRTVESQTQFIRTTFVRNDSTIRTAIDGIHHYDSIPYNSSIWYNGSRHELSAPFLDFGYNW